MLVACDVLFLLSPSKLPLQLSAIIATKAATIAVGHLQHHWKAPSLNRLRLKKIIKWITKTHSTDVSAKADPAMSALEASKIVEQWYFKISGFFTIGQKKANAGTHKTPQKCYKVKYGIFEIPIYKILKTVKVTIKDKQQSRKFLSF